jgi:hypothetical protein
MKRRQLRLLVITVIAGLNGMVEGCGGANSVSTIPMTPSASPTTSTGPTTPAGNYTIAGVITAYGGAPVSGMNVGAYPYPYGEGR